MIFLFQLKEVGFRNIDGLDPSEGMLELCRSKNVYTNLICDYVGEERTSIDSGINILYPTKNLTICFFLKYLHSVRWAFLLNCVVKYTELLKKPDTFYLLHTRR